MNGNDAMSPTRARSAATSSRLRSTRSASTPASGEKVTNARMRSVSAVPTTTVASRPASWYANAASATLVTPLPSSDVSCAANSRTKSRFAPRLAATARPARGSVTSGRRLGGQRRGAPTTHLPVERRRPRGPPLFEPLVHHGEDDEREQRRREQPADDDRGERPLHLGARTRRERHRDEAEARDQRRHEDRAQPHLGALPHGLVEWRPAVAELVDVGHEHHTVQHRHAEERDEA